MTEYIPDFDLTRIPIAEAQAQLAESQRNIQSIIDDTEVYTNPRPVSRRKPPAQPPRRWSPVPRGLDYEPPIPASEGPARLAESQRNIQSIIDETEVYTGEPVFEGAAQPSYYMGPQAQSSSSGRKAVVRRKKQGQ